MLNAYVSIGIPASGKSTFMRTLAQVISAIYVSSDAIREEITGDAGDVSRDEEIWPIAYERARTGLRHSDVVFDSTAAKRRDRVKLVEHLAQFSGSVVGIYFPTDIEVCRVRNERRDRVVPDFVLDNMQRALNDNPPSLSDGFDKLVIAGDKQLSIVQVGTLKQREHGHVSVDEHGEDGNRFRHTHGEEGVVHEDVDGSKEHEHLSWSWKQRYVRPEQEDGIYEPEDFRTRDSLSKTQTSFATSQGVSKDSQESSQKDGQLVG